MRRTAAPLLLSIVLLVGSAGCSSSDDDAAPTTTTTTTEATSTTGADAPSTTAGSDGEPVDGLPADCQAVLQQYVDTMNPDDLQSTADLFRAWAPDLPPEVAEAALRLADAYEEAGSLDAVDVGDPSLGVDGQTLSTWMDSGCPAP